MQFEVDRPNPGEKGKKKWGKEKIHHPKTPLMSLGRSEDDGVVAILRTDEWCETILEHLLNCGPVSPEVILLDRSPQPADTGTDSKENASIHQSNHAEFGDVSEIARKDKQERMRFRSRGVIPVPSIGHRRSFSVKGGRVFLSKCPVS